MKQSHGDVHDLQAVTPSGRDFQMLVAASHHEHYRNNAYENFTADLLLSLSHGAALFLDVGAHFGFYTLLFGMAFRDRRILAFEPEPENFDVLERNIELNRLQNVEACNLAVSIRNERRNFNIASHSSHSSFYQHHLSETIKTIEVETVCLDDFLKDIPSGSIAAKIDAEGAEMAIINGMADLLRMGRDIKIIIEFNPNSLRIAGYAPEALLHRIYQFGYDLYFIDDENRQTFKVTPGRLDNWESYFGVGNFRKDYFNVLCVKQTASLSACFFAHSAQLGGAERSLLELTTELIHDHGALCTVILPEPGPLEAKLHRIGASTHILNYSWWCDSTRESETEIKNRLINSFRLLLQALAELDRINPDMIYTQTIVLPWGAIAALFLGKPHVWSVNEFGQRDHGLHFYFPRPQILEFIHDSSNLIVAISNAVRNALIGDCEGNEILTLRRYIDIPSDALTPNSPEYFTRTTATKLVIAGQITEAKGQLDAVLAVKELVRSGRDIELIIIGSADPSYLSALTHIVQNENLEGYIKFFDFEENVYPLLYQADIVLVCSRSEAAGRVALEAMLLKKVVVGTRAGGTVELVQEGITGLLYEPGDYGGLANKIEWLVNNQEKILEFGANGYRYASENYTREGYGGRIYESLRALKKTPNRSASEYMHLLTWLVRGEQAEHLAHRDRELNDLWVELEHRAEELHQLRTKLVRCGDEISTLQAGHLATQRIQAEQVSRRDAELDELRLKLRRNAEELDRARSGLASMESERAWLRQQIQQIRVTRIWRLAARYWWVHAWLRSRLPH